ncbi:carbonic anhydrase [Thozetella sp. PMI_491]|nr:carbonic anhydrase [Thozetella sp. PMI_491]
MSTNYHQVTCCDPRCIPEQYFDLTHLQAIVHRNAGGAIRDALRDILILDTLFKLEEIAIVHHTDCGTLCFTDDQIRSSVKEWVDKAHWAEIDEMAFGGKSDIVQGVKRDLQWVRESPFIRDALKKGTQGFVFDLKTGKVDKVEME